MINNREHDTSDLQQKCIRRINPLVHIFLLNTPIPNSTTFFFSPEWAFDKTLKVNFVIEKHEKAGIVFDPQLVSFLKTFLDSSPRHRVTFCDKDPIIVGVFGFGDPLHYYEDFRDLCEKLQVKPDVLRYMKLGPALYLPTFPEEELTNRVTIPHIHTVVLSNKFTKCEVSQILRSNRHPNLPDIEKVVILEPRICSTSMDQFTEEIVFRLGQNGQKWKENREQELYYEWVRLR